MLWLLATHLAAALVAPALVGRLGRRAFWVLALVPASAAVWALSWTERVRGGAAPQVTVGWIPALGLDLDLRLDTLSWLMTLIVGGVGALVLVYCRAYFKADAQGLGRFAGVFLAFAGSMLGLVLSDDLLLLFVFWELTTVMSYLLIGHYAESRKASRRAAMQAIVVTTAGGLTMLVGLVILQHVAGTSRLSELLAHPPHGPAVTAAVVCLLVGAATKSALIPFHFWLPAAMAAPTPVSAYLHAAAMVKAGVYLVARFAPAYADLSVWRWLVLIGGGGTLLLGGYRSLRQHDLKLVLAFGTVSQLGLIVLLVGLGTPAAALAGLAMLGAHALFKAALFLVVGTVDAAAGTRDLRRLSGVGRELPWVAAAGALAVASMIGLPPFAGFVAKEAGLEAVAGLGGATGAVVLTVVAVGSVLTVAYGLRLWWGAFATKRAVLSASAVEHADGSATTTPISAAAADGAPPAAPAAVRPSSPVLVVPALVLAAAGLVVALVPGYGEGLLRPYADAFTASHAASGAAAAAGAHAGHLTLWAGLTPTLVVTVAVLLAGALAFRARDGVERAQGMLRLPPRVDADHLYRRSMRRLDDVAADVTAFTQRGSLPVYLGLILGVFVVGVGTALLTGTRLPTRVVPYHALTEVAFALVSIVAAVLAARARRRLKAVILTGIGGYAVAGLFLLQGAPDLALTQVLVETVTLVVFVLVLRRLPPYFSDRPLAGSRWLRLGIGVAVGLVVAGIGLIAPGARVHLPVSAAYAQEAYAFGGGKNVVNVTLVDIRAWDTMGEISVLLVAATGVASLVFVSRRTGRIFRAHDAPADRAVWGGAAHPRAVEVRGGEGDPTRGPVPGPTTRPGPSAPGSGRAREWLRAGRTLAPVRRSVIFEVVVRLLFHTMVMYSLFLLFSGHNNPGGGFAAGLVTGIALIVRYLAGGRYELGEAAPVQPGVLLGTGLFLATGVAVAPLLLGGSVLESAIVEAHLPLVGDVHLVTSLGFDVGVYLVVVGLVLDVLRSLGAELDRRAEFGEDDVEESVPDLRRTPHPAGFHQGASR
ncbi:Na+/H+ antiporter subunit A [Cellulomonas sp. NTE-D12]|uniref:Na+/H+ antiporter subunit A n=1 Tax=Cellulomonas sp. NTE-D12 TaxID=2962632 RepID=UPI00308155AF|nr:Na+/H+ antiporter subunit A [Cellulomonas sp. NTE-D12]